MSPTAEPGRTGLGRRDALAVVTLLAATLALTLPAILAGALGPKAHDHRFFHLPLVREWAAVWPLVDLSDYNSATGPLYHWLMAGAARIVGLGSGEETSVPLQTTSALFAWTLACVVYLGARRRSDPLFAMACGVPVLLSPYVLGNAIWMMTDNLSLTLIAISIGLAAFGSVESGSRFLTGAAAALAVATRQINLWLLAPLAASWWLGGRRNTLAVLGAAVLPCAVLLGFVLLWKGLVPPRFRTLHASGTNPAAIGYTLTLIAAYGVCLLPAVVDGARRLAARRGTLFAISIAGAMLAALGPSDASLEAGRNGGWLWTLVERMPLVADRSVVLLFGGSAGLIVIAALFLELEPAGGKHTALVLLAALAGFIAAHVANAQIFQRYYDPMVLLTLVWLATTLPKRGITRWCLLALAIQQAIFAAVTLYAPMGS
jgi:hypothetical protein